MNDTDLLPRRLSAPGCVIAGHQLRAQRKGLADKKIKLVKEVEAAVEAVVDATEAIVELEGDDTRMTYIDRGADRFIYGFDGVFAEIERSFDYADVLPLTPAEEDLRDTARSLRARLFPQGTDFTRTPYRAQWERMNALHVEMQRPESAAALKKLGLTLWAARFARWVALYGGKLGVTQAQGHEDPIAKAVDTWHEAWANLLLDVRASYRDRAQAEHAMIREQLLSPYDAQARQERGDEVKAVEKAKRREKKPEPPTK